MPVPQTLKNHARLDPPFHFFVLTVLLVNFIFSIVATVRHWPNHAHLFAWWIMMSVVLLVASLKIRTYSLKVQDRVIRLEEKLRMNALLSAAEYARASELTEAQFVALRFASDAELPGLVKRTLDEKLAPKQIKEAIVAWRPDYFRV